MKQLHRKLVQAGAVVAAAALLAACSSSSKGNGNTTTGSPSSGSGAQAVEKDTLTFSYSNAIMQVEKVPLHLALENLDKDGISTKETYNQNGNDAVQQVVRGEADFGTANAATVLAAIKKGVPIKAVMEAYRPFYILVAPSSVKDAAGLDGLRVGIQSKVSSTTLYTDLALATAPSAKPNILIVPGSANRVQAMIAGQLDASVLQPADWLTLQQKAPGKFHVIYDVAQQNPKIIDSLIFVSTKTLSSAPNYVRKFLAALQKEYATIYQDQDALAGAIAKLVPKTTEANAKELAADLIKDKIWAADGGFSQDRIQATLDAMKEAGLLKSDELPTASECCTTEFLSSSSGS